MRLLHVTDFHFRRPWHDWLVNVAQSYDAVAFTGDLLDMFPSAATDLYAQARWVRDWLKTFPVPIFLCSGNHDWWTAEIPVNDPFLCGGWLRQVAREGVYPDGSNLLFLGHRFICTPWIEKPLCMSTEPTVLLVHAPPLGTAVSSDLGHEVGDPDVADALRTLPPGSLVLSGHIHFPLVCPRRRDLVLQSRRHVFRRGAEPHRHRYVGSHRGPPRGRAYFPAAAAWRFTRRLPGNRRRSPRVVRAPLRQPAAPDFHPADRAAKR